MTNFVLIVDEHGDLNADKDSKPYGYGFLLGEQGPTLTEVERAIESAFPAGFHLKTYRGQRNKLAKARKMLSLLPVTGHFYGGGWVQTNPAYGRTKLYDVISGRSGGAPIPLRGLSELVNDAPLGPGGLVLPEKVMPDVLKITRLLTIYSSVLRLPVIALQIAVERPEDVVLDVQLGTVGHRRKYEARMKKIFEPLLQDLQRSLAKFVAEGIITNVPKEINIKTTPGKDPLFGVADLFAGVALHHHRYTMDENYSLGQKLYTAAKPILDRLPWQPSQEELVKGIVKL